MFFRAPKGPLIYNKSDAVPIQLTEEKVGCNIYNKPLKYLFPALGRDNQRRQMFQRSFTSLHSELCNINTLLLPDLKTL